MSSCCTGDSCQESKADVAADICPECGKKAAKVEPITLKALLTAEGLRLGVPPNPRFCGNPSCDVVYFDASVPVTFLQRHLTVPVHVKQPDKDNVPVCYCFGHTPASIRDEVTATGKSSAFATITAEVKAGHCACEVKNPKGECCLGDVLTAERGLLVDLAVETR